MFMTTLGKNLPQVCLFSNHLGPRHLIPYCCFLIFILKHKTLSLNFVSFEIKDTFPLKITLRLCVHKLELDSKLIRQVCTLPK